MKYRTSTGELTAAALHLGYVQEYGPHVSICAQHGVFQIRRHPAHPKGHAMAAARTVKEARKAARALAGAGFEGLEI